MEMFEIGIDDVRFSHQDRDGISKALEDVHVRMWAASDMMKIWGEMGTLARVSERGGSMIIELSDAIPHPLRVFVISHEIRHCVQPKEWHSHRMSSLGPDGWKAYFLRTEEIDANLVGVTAFRRKNPASSLSEMLGLLSLSAEASSAPRSTRDHDCLLLAFEIVWDAAGHVIGEGKTDPSPWVRGVRDVLKKNWWTNSDPPGWVCSQPDPEGSL